MVAETYDLRIISHAGNHFSTHRTTRLVDRLDDIVEGFFILDDSNSTLGAHVSINNDSGSIRLGTQFLKRQL